MENYEENRVKWLIDKPGGLFLTRRSGTLRRARGIIMKKNNAYFILMFICSILFTDCSINNLDKQTRQNYTDILSLYPDSLVSFFPHDISKAKVFYLDMCFPKGNYMSYIHVGIEKNAEEIELLKTKLQHSAKEIYESSDSCMILLHSEVIDGGEKLWFENNKCNKITNMFPIPYFDFLKDSRLETYNATATFYVLNAEQGKFLTDDVLAAGISDLSEKWKHGYTKGIVICKNEAMYWLNVW